MPRSGHMNAPTFAYYAVYGRRPDEPMRGRTDSPKKTWHGITDIDKHIKDKWLEELNSISEIEVRATDEGKSEDRVAFVIFRMDNPAHDSRAETISRRLDQMEGIYSECDIGSRDRPRVVVAGKVQYGKSGWERWWNTVANMIECALHKNVSASIIDEDGWYPGKILRKFMS